jgi:hypothetical protein
LVYLYTHCDVQDFFRLDFAQFVYIF